MSHHRGHGGHKRHHHHGGAAAFLFALFPGSGFLLLLFCAWLLH